MAYVLDPQMEHLLRRAGFGARPDELQTYRALSISGAIGRLLNYESIPDDVDAKIGAPGYVSTRGAISPNTIIADARQRWLFRMVHSDRPLQEKMTLFWHNHFATGYSKIAGVVPNTDAVRYMAAKASEDPGHVRGQLEMLRDNALGRFRDILVNIAQDTAMLYWLDGYTNTKNRPQENFGREIMELFTMGVGYYTEPDVTAAARVFTGWNLTRVGAAADGSAHTEFNYVPNQHDTGDKTFSFPVYSDGSRTIRSRAASSGLQDGLDLINALAASPETARYLARKIYRFFISEVGDIPAEWVDRIASVYLRSDSDMRAVMQAVLTSSEFWDTDRFFTRYSWPVEFVVRAVKEVGWTGFSLGNTLTPLGDMGQNLYDPPDVAGWDLGRSWFSTGSMLARMNFASALAGNQRINLAAAAKPFASSPAALLSYVLDLLKTPVLDANVTNELSNYLRATTAWTGSAAQVQTKIGGLVHLVASTPEYQFI